MQVHNLVGVEAMIPVLQEWKKAGRIGYYGITTSQPNEHGQMMDYMRRLPMDFIQMDYSLANRGAAQEVLPLAAQKGIAVIANSPFGGRRAAASVFGQVAGKPLPDWAVGHPGHELEPAVPEIRGLAPGDHLYRARYHDRGSSAGQHGSRPWHACRTRRCARRWRRSGIASNPDRRTGLIQTVASGRPPGGRVDETCQLMGCQPAKKRGCAVNFATGRTGADPGHTCIVSPRFANGAPLMFSCELGDMTKIYVGNLPFSADESQVRALFAQHGTVESVNVIMDRETGRPRGFAFVEMSNADASRAIQSLNGFSMGGRALRVNEAQDRPPGGGGGRGPGGGGGGGPRRSGGGGGGGGPGRY